MVDEVYSLGTLENTFAAWLDGALDNNEEAAFMNYCSHNNELQEILDANDQVEASYEDIVDNGYELPSEMYGEFEIPSTDMDDLDSNTSLVYLHEEQEEDNDVDEDSDTFSSTYDCQDFELI